MLDFNHSPEAVKYFKGHCPNAQLHSVKSQPAICFYFESVGLAVFNARHLFHREIVSVVPPAPKESSPFVSIDDEAFEAHRESGGEGGCGCQAADRCQSSRCQKCFDRGIPCTTRCKCLGECGNPHTMPLPDYLTCFPAEDALHIPLEEILPQLTPRDIEFWTLTHGKFGHYWFQYKLCDLSAAASCWYCSRIGVRQLPDLRFFPIVPTPTADGKWLGLKERVTLLASRPLGEFEPFLSDSPLPSFILAKAWQADQTLAPAVLTRLVASTNLKAESIVKYFRRRIAALRPAVAEDA